MSSATGGLFTPFLKFEDCCRRYRPQFKYKHVPQIQLKGDLSSGIFSSGKKLQNATHRNFHKKSTYASYSECCQVSYSNMQANISSFQHRMFVITESNNINLDVKIYSDIEENEVLEIELGVKQKTVESRSEASEGGEVSELGAVHICHSAAFKHAGTPVKLVDHNTTSSGSDLHDNV